MFYVSLSRFWSCYKLLSLKFTEVIFHISNYYFHKNITRAFNCKSVIEYKHYKGVNDFLVVLDRENFRVCAHTWYSCCSLAHRALWEECSLQSLCPSPGRCLTPGSWAALVPPRLPGSWLGSGTSPGCLALPCHPWALGSPCHYTPPQPWRAPNPHCTMTYSLLVCLSFTSAVLAK